MDLTLLRKLPVFLTAALYSGLTTWTGLAHADGIVADGGTATTVDQVGQTDVVNIATPSGQGVSHNTFDRYDIDQHGAVLNNSRVDGTSTLAGELQANPNLSGGSANIILNEVTSNRRSDLEGMTELFGDNARYILANPNGITCDGCGFIRTPTAAGDTGNRLEQVLLSTATPSLDTLGSTPVHLQVDEDNNARLIIGQGGLDAGNVDITTLLTRRAEINGLIDALDGELQLYAGAGSLGVNQDGSASWQAMDGADNRPTVAIDAAAAGAMHAGQIFIQSTDEGTGVTLPPDLISTRDIRISAAGDIVYTDVEAQGGQVQVTAGGTGVTLTAQGTTRAGDDVVLDAADDIDTGSILAGNNILVTSRNGQVAVRDATADGDVTVTAEDDVQYRHITASSGNVTVTTASDTARIRTTGHTRAGNTLTWNISGPEAVVAAGTGGLEAGATVRFNCVSGEGTCALRSLRDLNLSATTVETQADITTTAGNDLRIDANLDSARDITSGGRLTITARDSDIRSRGRLAAAGDMTLTAAANSEIRLEGDLHGGGELYLRGEGTYRHTDNGDFQLAGDWHIDLFGLTNEGILSDLHDGTLQVSHLDNRGLIENQAALILQVDDTLDNSGILASLEGAVDIGHSQAGQSTRQITNRGIIAAIDLTSNQTGDTGMILDPAALIQDHTRAILAGEQRSAADLTRRINTANAELIAELNLNAEVTGVLNIDATSLTNQAGGRISGSDLNLDIDTLNNHGGQLLAGRNLTLNGDELNNTYAG
ncbi:MAG: filamentous hemagglutinin N-terminal domain-containing protein, partial [Pseudomonadota bacterium]|nr:filamentous hemagglutinin N-terminal domain-containing protein [Pseudomonadota bacterium]